MSSIEDMYSIEDSRHVDTSLIYHSYGNVFQELQKLNNPYGSEELVISDYLKFNLRARSCVIL